MPVDAVFLMELRKARASHPDLDGSELAPLSSTAMVIAYMTAMAREDGINEVDAVETHPVELAELFDS